MKICGILLLSAMLAACATPELAPRPDRLFSDALFKPSAERIRAEDVFALSASMKRFLASEISPHLRAKGLREGLVEALYTKGQLKLEYDLEITRNASEAFDARSGNCLSLVIMTAALAKELGLAVRYQRVYVDDAWTRSGGVYFASGHVNLSLGRRHIEGAFGRDDSDVTTIDFLPPLELRGVRTQLLGENRIVAMYLNNRSAEALVRGDIDSAYWWARAAIDKDSDFLGAYNTLGVIYQRHGNADEAERVLAYAVERDPTNANALANLTRALDSLGRTAERNAVARRLEKLEPDPPFSDFNRGRAKLLEENYEAARDLFAREVARAPYYHEFHFWLAIALAGLGDVAAAREELTLAIEYSTTRKDRELYAAKLNRIKATRVQ